GGKTAKVGGSSVKRIHGDSSLFACPVSAAYHIDTHAAVDAFVKNAGLGFAIPYLHNRQPHDDILDFIIRLSTAPVAHLILETKGFDDLAGVKAAAAEWWIAAVNADG